MQKLAAAASTLLGLGFLASALFHFTPHQRVTGTALPAAGACLPDQQVAVARAAVHETETTVRWVTRAWADHYGMSKAGAWAEPGRVTIVMDAPCEYVTSMAIHEFTHEAEFRKAGGMVEAFRMYGDKELERVAQCRAVASGFPSYRAYGVLKPSDCSAYELASARSLATWNK